MTSPDTSFGGLLLIQYCLVLLPLYPLHATSVYVLICIAANPPVCWPQEINIYVFGFGFWEATWEAPFWAILTDPPIYQLARSLRAACYEVDI